MKKLIMISIVFGFLLLSGCSESEPADATVSVEGIYTSVALTITAQYTPITATDTALPTSKLTPIPSPSETPTPPATTSIPVSYSYSSSSVSNSCDSSTYISDVTIADGTVLAPGQSFKKTWLLENTGSCEWSKDYLIAFISGDEMSGTDTEIDTVVSSGEQVKVSVDMIAPETEGTYTGFWKMMNEEGEIFGTSVYVQIIVSDDASTITPTSTATTYTSTPTSTTVSSATPTSALSFTSNPTSTPTPTMVIVPTNTPIPASPTVPLQPIVESTPTLEPNSTTSAKEAIFFLIY